MTAWEKLTRNEQVLLLGFFPLLGATVHVATALTAALIGVAASGAIRIAARHAATWIPSPVIWGLYAALGLTIAHIGTDLLTFWLPVPSAAHGPLYLTGLAPIVFSGASPSTDTRTFQHQLLRYVVWVLVFGVIRETLGRGSLLGVPLWPDGTIPFGVLAHPTGAFLLLATVALFSAVAAHRKSVSSEAQA